MWQSAKHSNTSVFLVCQCWLGCFVIQYVDKRFGKHPEDWNKEALLISSPLGASRVSTMPKKKVAVTQAIDSKDGGATNFWFFMAALVIILVVGLRMFTAMPYKPPLAKTDIYSGYRWARCDSNHKHCNREYSETTTTKIPQYTARRGDCTQDTQHAGVPIILYSKDPHEHFSDKRAVGSNWVYSRVAREFDELRSEGIDPVRLENLLVSLAQTSSGNVGESIALKRPDLEERYWEQLKAFVHKYPEPETGDVQVSQCCSKNPLLVTSPFIAD